MSDWPFRSECRRVWAPPERYRGFLAVAVPDGMEQIIEAVPNPPAPPGVAEYEGLLASRVHWMYLAAGSPLRAVQRKLRDMGEYDLLLNPERSARIGSQIVRESPLIQTMLCRVGLSDVLPAVPVQDPEIVELLQDTCLDEWLQCVADWAGPYESLT